MSGDLKHKEMTAADNEGRARARLPYIRSVFSRCVSGIGFQMSTRDIELNYFPPV